MTLSDVQDVNNWHRVEGAALYFASSPPLDRLQGVLTFKTRDNQVLHVHKNGVIVSHVTASEKREFLTFNASEIQDIELLEVDDPVAALESFLLNAHRPSSQAESVVRLRDGQPSEPPSAAPQPTSARVGALQQQNQIDLESVHPLVGKRISLLTSAGARYEGRLEYVASFPITCIA